MRTAAVIGGSSELAGAVLSALASRGLETVVLCGRDRDGMARVAGRLALLGVGRVEQLFCDVERTGTLAALAGEVVGLVGRLDLLLVAAGRLGPETLEELDPETVGHVLTSTFGGPAAAVMAFVPALRRQGGGRIVVLSSVAGLRVRRANFAYGAAKAGLDGFCQGLADALAGTGIEMILVRPGFVHTKMTAGRRPQPLAVGPEQVATAVVRGLDRGSPVVYVPASLRPVFFLARLLPRSLWRRLPR